MTTQQQKKAFMISVIEKKPDRYEELNSCIERAMHIVASAEMLAEGNLAVAGYILSVAMAAFCVVNTKDPENLSNFIDVLFKAVKDGVVKIQEQILQKPVGVQEN